MARAIIYTKDWCPFCKKAKALLDSEGVTYEEIDVTHDPVKEEEMRKVSGRTTVPQIFLHVGGCDDLHAYRDASSKPDLLSNV
jgi:glutaredoxin 3